MEIKWENHALGSLIFKNNNDPIILSMYPKDTDCVLYWSKLKDGQVNFTASGIEVAKRNAQRIIKMRALELISELETLAEIDPKSCALYLDYRKSCVALENREKN